MTAPESACVDRPNETTQRMIVVIAVPLSPNRPLTALGRRVVRRSEPVGEAAATDPLPELGAKASASAGDMSLPWSTGEGSCCWSMFAGRAPGARLLLRPGRQPQRTPAAQVGPQAVEQHRDDVLHGVWREEPVGHDPDHHEADP